MRSKTTASGGDAAEGSAQGDACVAAAPKAPIVLQSAAPTSVDGDTPQGASSGVTAARVGDGPMVPDYGPLRATGLWKVEEVLDAQRSTVDFRRIDDVESEVREAISQSHDAVVLYKEEEAWKHKLMFVHKFKKTPKHLTWRELGEEIECLDCVIEVDEHRPEEIFTILFYFTDKKTGTRDVLWRARNDVSYSEGFTDLLAAIGASLGRSSLHRTIRFDDGMGTTRDISIRKVSRYTSDITLAFRPAVSYNKYERKSEQDEYEQSMAEQGMSTWGFHPNLMDPEYNTLDFQDPPGTYTTVISAHAFSFIYLRAINRLLARPLREFYRPSQVMRTAKVRTEDDLGLVHAMKGWMGIEEQIYPHYTTIEAIQEHWLGKDAPFSLVAIVNKVREMTYLKRQNPEFQSWLSIRHHDTHLAVRNIGLKMLGVGASTLFVPAAHNETVNRLLPKHQQRRLESRFSLNSLLGVPDETRHIGEFKKLTGCDSITDSEQSQDERAESLKSKKKN